MSAEVAQKRFFKNRKNRSALITLSNFFTTFSFFAFLKKLKKLKIAQKFSFFSKSCREIGRPLLSRPNFRKSSNTGKEKIFQKKQKQNFFSETEFFFRNRISKAAEPGKAALPDLEVASVSMWSQWYWHTLTQATHRHDTATQTQVLPPLKFIFWNFILFLKKTWKYF